MKENGELIVCVDFRDLNVVTPKDMYVMPVANMLLTPFQIINYCFSWTISLSITKS